MQIILATVHLFTFKSYSCTGCDHVSNSETETDKCGVCTTPELGNQCLDCAGEPWGVLYGYFYMFIVTF